MAAAEQRAIAADTNHLTTDSDITADRRTALNVAHMRDLETLRYQYHVEQALPRNLEEHSDRFNPLLRYFKLTQNYVCRDVAALADMSPDDLNMSEQLFCATSIRTFNQARLQSSTQSEPTEPPIPVELDSADADPFETMDGELTNDLVSRNNASELSELGQITEINLVTRSPFIRRENEVITQVQKAANRNMGNTYSQSIFSVEGMQSEMRRQLNAVHFWALPIIYGALGALTYCLWRTLTPRVSSLGFWHPVMRMIFAGLAALTISMLFIPANVFAIDQNAQKPLIYLMSFIFGYSIEGFIRLLNRMNSAIEASTSDAPRATS
jgi:hypothetical protein